MKRAFTVDELANELGVSKNTVQSWRKQGMPAEKGKSRNSTLRFDRLAITAWFSERGMAKYVYALMPDTGTITEAPEIDDKDVGIENILERLRGIERYAYNMYTSSNERLKGFWMKEHRETAEQLRKWEKEWATIQLAQGAVISIDEHDKVVRSMCVEIRQRIESMPSQAAPLCEGMSVENIFEILTKETVKILEALHNG